MEKDKIKVFLKSLFRIILISLAVGIVVGALVTALVVYTQAFLDKLISNVAFGTGVLALATIVLAILTYWNIRSHNAQEKRERKERWLNAIIAWATQILECGRGPRQYLDLKDSKLTSFEFDSDITLQSAFVMLSWRAVHIGFLAQHSVGDKDVYDAVEHTRTLVRQQSKILSLAASRKIKNNAAIGKHREKVDNAAKKVIELAVKLL